MYRRVLVHLDGSAKAERVLPYAIAHAACHGAELILLKVQEPIANTVGVAPVAMEKAKEQADKIARDYLARVAAPIRNRGGLAVNTVLVEGRPHVEIPRFAEENEVDLIVLPTPRRSGLSRWLTSSLSDLVTRESRVPVMLVQAEVT